ncbi:uncharacterized protein BCR38DRAFT_491394 [Pseudomassariella vexata]|uniref:BZIP domain-containing protein n=1 Tax=Pseudomassariella vexata TaxID=1141098 RepID=A0A1Y2D5Z5_9PEZI|nr:uncharacterized protein BCR38DRAFT_491394 [Pseudomassariella vexata]ORY54702.1 hypothetical protein BCR38DRAFT_491394 [Pseudomassariella vexata]
MQDMNTLEEALNAKYFGVSKPYDKAEFDKWFSDYVVAELHTAVQEKLAMFSLEGHFEWDEIYPFLGRPVRIPESRDENRLSQQRSRERRKQYVADLEKRVSEYERLGVQATLEMQRAARAVHIKNGKLLALLALHGVKQDEIDAFLAAPGTVDPTEAPNCNEPRMDDTSGNLISMMDNESSLSGCRSSLVLAVEASGAAEAGPSRIPLPLIRETEPRRCSMSCVKKSQDDGPPGYSCVMTDGRSPPVCNDESDELRGQATCCDESGESSGQVNCCDESGELRGQVTCCNESGELRGQVTSCDEAAIIIANLRGNDNVTEARALLGCGSATVCSVKNTRLFQLMDETP